MAKAKPFKRQMHITLSEQAHKDLDELRRSTGASSLAELIRNSLAVTKYLDKERAQGNEIIIRDPKSNKEKVIVDLR